MVYCRYLKHTARGRIRPSRGSNAAHNQLLKYQEKIKMTFLAFFGKKIKQWPLAGEFVECEYSPKIRQFGEFKYSPEWLFFDNRSDSIHSTDIRQPFSPDSLHSTDIRQPFSPDSIHSTDIRQPFSPDSLHSTDIRQGSFWKNVTRI
jgi:hypothetical protein